MKDWGIPFSVLFTLTMLSILLSLGSSFAGQVDRKVAELETTGPYEVGFSYFMLIDTSRNPESGFGGRPIPVALWYPVDPVEIRGGTSKAEYPFDPYDSSTPMLGSSSLENYGIDPAYHEVPVSPDAPFPLVIFSPGWGSHYVWHVSVGTRLASHGFVVVVLSHYGDGATPSDSYHHLSMAALSRSLDISFVLDDILARNADSSDALFRLLRPDQIAASGWSLGGYAAMALTGGDDLVCDRLWFEMGGLPPDPEACVPVYPDDRIKVILPLDGSNQVMGFQELARITAPTIGIGRSWETVWDWQARQHAAIQGHPCYRVDLANSHHVSFSDICALFPAAGDEGLEPPDFVEWIVQNFCEPFVPFPVAHQLVGKYMLAFLKTQLLGESGYQAMLTPGWALKNEPLLEFFVTEKKNPNAIDDDWPDLSIYFQDQPGSNQSNAQGQELGIPYMGFWW